jgi:hypothetical protein
MKRSQMAGGSPCQHGNIIYCSFLAVKTLTAVDAIDGGKSGEYGKIGTAVINSVQTKPHGGQDSRSILATVNKMRENILGIIITPDTLQSSPNWRQGSEESQESRVAGITLFRFVPLTRVEAKE